MKFLASGDHHFDEHSPRWDEVVRVHGWIAEQVEATRPIAFLSGGDIFERKSTPRERLAVATFFQRVAAVCPVLITRGNHDALGDLQILSRLETVHAIHVIEQTGVVTLRDDRGHVQARVGCMAWPTRQGVTDEGAARESIRTVLAAMASELNEGAAPKILLGHFDVRGATVGEGQPLISGALTVGLEDLAVCGADAVVMSHIHRPQVWRYSDRPMGYAGSPCRHDFGEVEPKGIVCVDIEAGVATWKTIPTPIREMLLLKGHFGPGAITSDAGNTYGTHFFQVELPPEDLVRGADIRLRYQVDREHRDAAKREAAKHEAMLLAMGAATVQVEDELVVTTRAREGAVAVAEERTLEGKLEAMWVAQNRVPEGPVKARLFGRLAELEVS